MAQTGLVAFNATISNPRTQDYLRTVLGNHAGEFVTTLTSLVANSATLQACEPLSLMYVGIKAASLHLTIDGNLGYAYAIPYKNNKTGKTEAQFQMGYKGFVQLALRSGQVKSLNVIEVHKGELIDENILTGEFTFKRANNREQLPVIGYAAYIKLTNGFEKSIYWDRQKVELHAQRYSQTYSSKNQYVRSASKWTTDFDAMAKKTVLKSLLNTYAPLSVEMQKAIQSDQAVYASQDVEQAIETQAVDVEPTYLDNDEQNITQDMAESIKTKADEVKNRAAKAMKGQQADTSTGELFNAPQTPENGENANVNTEA